MSALPPFTSCTLFPAHFFCQLSTGRLLPASASMSFAAQTADYFSAQYFSAEYFSANISWQKMAEYFTAAFFNGTSTYLYPHPCLSPPKPHNFFSKPCVFKCLLQTAPSFAPRSVEQTQQATVTFKIAFVITDNKNTSRNIHRPSSQRKHVKVEQKIWLNFTDLLIRLFANESRKRSHIIMSYFFWSQCCYWFGLRCFERPIHNFFQLSKF